MNPENSLLIFRFVKTVIAVAFVFFACTACLLSSNIKEIDAQDLKKMIYEGTTMVLVDTRSVFEYDNGYIPGAIHIPFEKFAYLPKLLPEDKTIPLVFYCRGSG